MTVEILGLPASAIDADEMRSGLAEIYASAFLAPPWRESDSRVDQFMERLRDDARRDGFRLVAAKDGGALVGFATSWITPAPFRADRAYGRVASALGEATVSERLCGAREVDELAVRADHRGQRIAARLLDATVGPGERAWLLTAPHADNALRFYRRIGWTELTAALPATDIIVFASP